jgi:hypothetical protein
MKLKIKIYEKTITENLAGEDFEDLPNSAKDDWVWDTVLNNIELDWWVED